MGTAAKCSAVGSSSDSAAVCVDGIVVAATDAAGTVADNQGERVCYSFRVEHLDCSGEAVVSRYEELREVQEQLGYAGLVGSAGVVIPGQRV